MVRLYFFVGLTFAFISCDSPNKETKLQKIEIDTIQIVNTELPLLKWPEDYENLGPPEGFTPADRPSIKDCVTINVIMTNGIGTREITYPTEIKNVDKWVKVNDENPKYVREWHVVKPETTVYLSLGSPEDYAFVVGPDEICG